MRRGSPPADSYGVLRQSQDAPPQEARRRGMVSRAVALAKGVSVSLDELVRIVILSVVLAPAARLLPRRLALAAADLAAVPLLLLPTPGFAAFADMRRGLGHSPPRALRLALEWLARPLRDFVMLRRVLSGREHPSTWLIEERNAEGVKALREAGESFILASGHFVREGLIGLFAPAITGARPIQVAGTPPARVRHLHDLRTRIQYGALLRALGSAWERPVELVHIGPEHLVPAVTLYKRLKDGGTVVSIHVDAAWDWRGSRDGAYERPYAGYRRKVCALGAAQLARLAGCPIVTCIYRVDRDGTIVLEWGDPIRDVRDERITMDRIIDAVERGVGEWPSQYVLRAGHERRWNAASKRWQDPTERPVAVASQDKEPWT